MGQIFVIRYVEGEILTAGIDGYVRSWSVETIDSAEPAEQSGLVEVEPMNEVLIGPDVQIYYFTKPFDVSDLLMYMFGLLCMCLRFVGLLTKLIMV